MTLADIQFDMFGQPVELETGRRPRPGTAKPKAKPARLSPGPMSHEDMAKALESSGLYRVARKLMPAPVAHAPRPGFPRMGVVVDTETTGLNHRVHEVIEIGVVVFSFDDAGQVGDVLGVYGGLQQPKVAIPSEITQLTGISNEMVEGRCIDFLTLNRLIDPVDLVIAHNAAFDRPFCEALTGCFDQKAWACTVKEIDWKGRGFEGTKLGYLLGHLGYFHDGHRAVDDCYALLDILTRPSGPAASPAFTELYEASQKARVRVWAQNSPFDMKETLKARHYRWSDGSDGKPKSWWTEVNEEAVEDELLFLKTDVYGRFDVEPLTHRLTAEVRYKG